MQGFLFRLNTKAIDITSIIESPEESNDKTLIFFLELLRKYE